MQMMIATIALMLAAGLSSPSTTSDANADKASPPVLKADTAQKKVTNGISKVERSAPVTAVSTNQEIGRSTPTLRQEALQVASLQANQVSAAAAIAMAAIGFFQLGLFGWQLWLMRRTVADAAESAEAARVAAQAASLNARAAIGIELPILTAAIFGLLRTSKPFDPFDAPGGTVNEDYPDRYSGVGPITFKNNGRTPALLDAIELGWAVAETLPETPSYQVAVPLEHFSIIPAGEEFQVPYELLVELTDEQQESIKVGFEKLWVYGSLHYKDFLGDRREARFCAHYDCRPRGYVNPFGFVYDGQPPKAYVNPIVHS